VAKASVLDMLYTTKKSPLEFNFDMLTAPPLLSLLTVQDIYELNTIARSVKLASKIDEKYKLIDRIMNNRGFVKLHAGTNRVVYRFIEDQSFVVKIAIDKVGLGDNPAEFRNQFLLKPFVTKVFEVSPCGTVGLFERVDAIMSREEFASVADDIFNLITKFFVGKYILEDFGCHYFMNWGIRKNGAGLVLLDFPYVFELDGNKLYCNKPINPFNKSIKCGGEIDYDDGFNNLICTKCGKPYHARDLKKTGKDQLIIVGGKKTMKVKVKVGSEVILDSSKKQVAKVIEPPKPEIQKPKQNTTMVVNKPKDAIFNKIEEKPKKIDEWVNSYHENDEEKIEQEEPVFIPDNYDKYTAPFDQSEGIPNIGCIGEDELRPENIDVKEEDTVDDPLDFAEDVEEDEEDVEDYDQYLSNRDRNEIRKEQKQQNRRNTNFGDF